MPRWSNRRGSQPAIPAAVQPELCYSSGVMMKPLLRVLLLMLFPCVRHSAAQEDPAWTTPLPPFQISDHLYYVGSRDLAAYLVATPEGDVLINADLERSPPQIRASVEKLGFHWQDIKLLLNSQAHFDHVAGAAQVVRETGARVETMQGDADVMDTGGRGDFYGKQVTPYPPVHVDRVLHDGDTVALGGVVLTAHLTAGHTRGCTTWTLREHVPGEPAGTLRHIVIVGGVAPLEHYRLVASGTRPVSYPGIAEDFQRTFATLEELHCDVFLGAHGKYFNMLAKYARMRKEGAAVWIDPAGYRAFVAASEASFRRELERQQRAARQ